MDIIAKLAKCGVPEDLLAEVAELAWEARQARAKELAMKVKWATDKRRQRGFVRAGNVHVDIKKHNEINGNVHRTEEREKEKERKVPPITPLKKEREREKEEYISVKFAEFWGLYTRKVAKLAALKAFKKVLSRGTEASVIITGASRYGEASRDKDPEYIKHPSTWLNGGCWEDFSEPTAGDINAERQRRVQEFLRQREQANGSGVEKAGNGLHREPAKGSPNGASDDPPWLTRVG